MRGAIKFGVKTPSTMICPDCSFRVGIQHKLISGLAISPNHSIGEIQPKWYRLGE